MPEPDSLDDNRRARILPGGKTPSGVVEDALFPQPFLLLELLYPPVD